jgi:hypothetical protein
VKYSTTKKWESGTSERLYFYSYVRAFSKMVTSNVLIGPIGLPPKRIKAPYHICVWHRGDVCLQRQIGDAS